MQRTKDGHRMWYSIIFSGSNEGAAESCAQEAEGQHSQEDWTSRLRKKRLRSRQENTPRITAGCGVESRRNSPERYVKKLKGVC